MFKKTVELLFCFVLSLTVHSQTRQIKALRIGDAVHDIHFKNVLNYKSKTLKLSAFKGKLVILDLWSTTCASCITAFPKMQALQDKFGDQLQILLVNPYKSPYDTEQKVKGVLQKLKARSGFYPSLPIPIYDTIINSYFPHLSVPHVIWIDKEGKVLAITGSSDVTESAISTYLEKRQLNLPVKNDWAFDVNTPLLVDGNGGDSREFMYRSIITGHKDELGSHNTKLLDSNNKTTKLDLINQPLFTLYQIAWSDVLHYPQNRTFIEVKDPLPFQMHKDKEQQQKYLYCYELIAPPMGHELYQYMREDLYRSFHAIARKEQRVVGIYALKTNSNLRQEDSNGQSSGLDWEETSLKKYIHKKPVSIFLEFLNNVLDKPVIDKTGYSGTVTMDFPFDIYSWDVNQWKAFLSKQGFDLVETEAEIEVAVITDKFNK